MLLDPLQARLLIQQAIRNRYAVLAVNADSHAAVTDCLEAARLENAPIIIETSLWQLTGWSFGAGDPALGMLRYLLSVASLANSEPYLGVPVVFHTDHIKGPGTLELLTAALNGLRMPIMDPSVSFAPSTISLDSSELTDEENIAAISALCSAATRADRALTLEMEAGVDDGLTPLPTARKLLAAVEAIHPGYLWLWAPGLGTKHGLDGSGYPEFSADAVAEHKAAAKEATRRDIGIALHGSSGVSDESLVAAVAAGVTKVNWSSESLLLRSRAAAAYFETHVQQLQPKHPSFKATAMDNGLQRFISDLYIPNVRSRIAVLNGSGFGEAFTASLRNE